VSDPDPLARFAPVHHNIPENMTLHEPIERVNTEPEKLWFSGVCVALALAVFFVYWPVRNHDFIKYDDDKYVTDNRNVQSGLTWRSVRWAFTSGYASNWHPVTWLSHMLDCEIFGLDPRGPHLVNLLLHIANTLLLFTVFKRMTGSIWPSAFVAAVFGLHPLHVESVAWVAERKDVLSTFFWMLTMGAYARYAERPGMARYLPVLLSFVLGLMAKPMLVTLPFVLLLLDYWPLERMRHVSIRSLLLEKVPLLALAGASSIVTFLVQRGSGAMQTIEAIDLKSRLANAVVAYVGYVEKMFWPSDLAVLYPHPGAGLSRDRVLLCGLLLVACSIVFLTSARRRKYLAVGWLWYAGTLVPVIGLVQVGVQAMADRYTYMPLTGMLIIIAWSLAGVLPQWRCRKPVLAALALAAVSSLAVVTSRQLRYWQNSVTLFEHTLAVTSDNYVMHNNYANFLMDSGNIADAIEHFHRSLEIKPGSAEVHNNLGNAYEKIDKVDDAIGQYRAALSLKPDFPEAHYNLALALSEQNKAEEAIREYSESVRLEPDNVDAWSNLGRELARQGDFARAIESYERALAIKPDHIMTHGWLGLALATTGKVDEAIMEFRTVLKARPTDVEMWRNLGILLERRGTVSEAIECYRRVLQIDPADAKTQSLLNVALSKER
jgi:tetratricopeptide (TPR) repeat protein